MSIGSGCTSWWGSDDAVVEGAHAADTVLRQLAGQSPTPVAVGFVGQCVSPGRHSAGYQVAGTDDRARGPVAQ